MKQHFIVTLVDDVVISGTAVTTGTHHSLDYIPGNHFLGAVASELYSTLSDTDEAWLLFHSGRVRFGNGYPLDTRGAIGYPIPLSLHHYKGDEQQISLGNRLQSELLVRPGLDNAIPGRQLKQLRSGYLAGTGAWLKPKRNARMKTAINRDTARAAEAQLFGYKSLQAGQRFLATIECCDSVPGHLQERLIASLEGEMRMGRSRSAQYGKVRLDKVNISETDVQPGTRLEVGDTSLTFWCLSDLALTDQLTSQPVLQPVPAHFGLCGGHLDLKRSFLRTRSYSPYNSYRGSFDSRRELLQQGSVISFSGLDPLTPEQVSRLQAPHGRYIEAGLGILSVQPALLVDEQLSFADATVPEMLKQKPKPVMSVSGSPLLQWLQQQAGARVENQLQGWVESMLSQIAATFQNARRLSGIGAALEVGPSASQWGGVYQVARDLRHHPQTLYEKLFEGEASAICRPRAGSAYSWELQVAPEQNFAQWLAKRLVESCDSNTQLSSGDTLFAERVALLAAEMRKPNGLKLRVAEREAEHA